MRSLEQCKAEVFRRSEKIIKQRKVVRRCIVAACVPLVLVLSVALAMVVPAMMPAKAENEMAVDSAVLADAEKYTESALGTSPAKTSVTIMVEGVSYSVFGEDALAAAEFLQELDYNPAKVCKCLPQFQVVTPDGSYGIHLGESYARCEAGQAALTIEQESVLLRLLHSAVPDWTPIQKNS